MSLPEPLPPIVSLRDASSLAALRFSADETNKVGLLPFYVDSDGTHRFLFAAPWPKHDGAVLPFAIARGTRQMEVETGEDRFRADVGRWQGDGRILAIEPPLEGALREGQEELGVDPGMILCLFDAGILRYKHYGIHLFMAHMPVGYQPGPAPDSRAVRWMTLPEARHMAATSEFHPLYLTLLEALASSLENKWMI